MPKIRKITRIVCAKIYHESVDKNNKMSKYGNVQKSEYISGDNEIDV